MNSKRRSEVSGVLSVESLDRDDEFIKSRIFTVRGAQVVLDRDLAELYGVQTKVLNQAVKRNANRFPSEFMFALAKDESEELVTNCDRFRSVRNSSVPMLTVKTTGVSHDRFLILDDKELYHFGASL